MDAALARGIGGDDLALDGEAQLRYNLRGLEEAPYIGVHGTERHIERAEQTIFAAALVIDILL